MIRKTLKEIVRQGETDLEEAARLRRIMEKRQADIMRDPNVGWLADMIMETLHIEPLEEGKEKKIREARYYLTLLAPRKKGDVFDERNAVTQGVTPEEIQRAKEIPIEHFCEFGRNKKGLCVFHNEKTPSMHLFSNNHAYCFSCSKGGDSISIYRAIYECGFIDAVKALNKI